MSEELILGIDGGGTKIIVSLAERSGKIRQTSVGAGVNPMDNPDWRAELDRSIAPFVRQPDLVAVAAALPAYGEVAELSRLQENAIRAAFPSARRTILNDVDAAHFGAFAGQAGILILSGTGSMAWARDSAGHSSRSGGWGDLIGDEGSSYWIGRLALNLVSQSLDGRSPATTLTRIIFDHLQIDQADAMNGLGRWATALAKPRSGIAALARLVDRAARDGDEPSRHLLEQAAGELARHYHAIADRCDGNDDWTYAGGTFSSAVLLEALEKRIGTAATAPKLPPIGGALLVAAQTLGWSRDEDWLEHTAASSHAAMTQT